MNSGGSMIAKGNFTKTNSNSATYSLSNGTGGTLTWDSNQNAWVDSANGITLKPSTNLFPKKFPMRCAVMPSRKIHRSSCEKIVHAFAAAGLYRQSEIDEDGSVRQNKSHGLPGEPIARFCRQTERRDMDEFPR